MNDAPRFGEKNENGLIFFSLGKWMTEKKFISSINNNITRKRAARRTNRRVYHWIDKYKIKKGCQQCGYNKHSCALSFDHLDFSRKRRNVSMLISQYASLSTPQYRKRKRKEIFSEIRKCQILCCNCHNFKSKLESKIYQPVIKLFSSHRDYMRRKKVRRKKKRG